MYVTSPIKAAFRSGIVLILGHRVQRSKRRIYAFVHAVPSPYRTIAPDGFRAIDRSPSFRGSDVFADPLWR